jgi:hypothetical protein
MLPPPAVMLIAYTCGRSSCRARQYAEHDSPAGRAAMRGPSLSEHAKERSGELINRSSPDI